MRDTSINVLLIEDNPGDARLIEELLSESHLACFQVEVAEKLSDGIEALSTGRFEVIVLDLSLPDSSGLETLEKVLCKTLHVSVIVLTGLADESLAIEAVRKGAQDYLVKGQIDQHLISRSIRYAIERKRAEEEKKRLEAQLQHAQRMEALGTLAGGIAHDFNNLLMAIQGNVSMMLYDIPASHQNYENLRNVEKQIKSGTKLTRQLLGYAKKGRYEVKAININQLIKETAETFGRTKKEIRIHLDLAEDLFAIEADEGQIEQILLNLFVNAADAMPGGGNLILKTMNVTHEDMKGKVYDPKPGDYVLLTVADSGTGMDRNTLERIFNPFFTTKEMGRGTGLGLASVYGIVKGHGGYIDVESRKRYGTTFSIHLPASVNIVESAPEPCEQIKGGDEIILIADDEAMVLDVGGKMLNKLGYTVLGARGGKEAVEVYGKNKDRINLVILDMIMPEIGGGEAYDLMKKINPDVRVLLSSGYTIDGQATEILERGCEGFIQKPFDMNQLSQKVREILDKNLFNTKCADDRNERLEGGRYLFSFFGKKLQKL